MWHDRESAAAQINRLSCLAGWQDVDANYLAELSKALMASVNSKPEAARVVDMLIRRKQFIPRPVDVYSEAQNIEVHLTSDENCQYCRGGGYEIVNLLVTYSGGLTKAGFRRSTAEVIQDSAIAEELRRKVDGINQTLTTGARFCRCSYGQSIKEQRKTAQARDAQIEAAAVARRNERERKSETRSRRDLE